MTTFRRSVHMRSPMIASAMTEHRISGQIGQPAASMMDNKADAPQKWPDFNGAGVFQQAMLRWSMMRRD